MCLPRDESLGLSHSVPAQPVCLPDTPTPPVRTVVPYPRTLVVGTASPTTRILFGLAAVPFASHSRLVTQTTLPRRPRGAHRPQRTPPQATDNNVLVRAQARRFFDPLHDATESTTASLAFSTGHPTNAFSLNHSTAGDVPARGSLLPPISHDVASPSTADLTHRTYLVRFPSSFSRLPLSCRTSTLQASTLSQK